MTTNVRSKWTKGSRIIEKLGWEGLQDNDTKERLLDESIPTSRKIASKQITYREKKLLYF